MFRGDADDDYADVDSKDIRKFHCHTVGLNDVDDYYGCHEDSDDEEFNGSMV